MNKSTYNQVANIINRELKKLDGDGLAPRVTVIDTSKMGGYCDKWSLMVNDDAKVE